MDSFSSNLISALISNKLVQSDEEADGIVAASMDQFMEIQTTTTTISEQEQLRQLQTCCKEMLREYFSLSDEMSDEILKEIFPTKDEVATVVPNDETKQDDDSSVVEDLDWMTSGRGGEEHDEEVIGDGECELCERYIRLTRHHLIPRATWPRIFHVLMNAVEAFKGNNAHRAHLLLGDGMMHLEDSLKSMTSSGSSCREGIKLILHRTIEICAQCHRTIHRTHSNMTLAKEYNTIDLLLRDETIFKFCKWVSRQKVGKYAMK